MRTTVNKAISTHSIECLRIQAVSGGEAFEVQARGELQLGLLIGTVSPCFWKF